ncbi:MAG: hypothetical protein PHT69_00300 [Bacteroidales bacterium]|nr:hypothetical protein [Bacteroidales bacterium]
MKTLKRTSLILSIIILTASLFTACMKDREFGRKKPSFKAIGDNAIADNIFADVFNQAGKSVADAEEQSKNKSGQYVQSGCPTVTISPFDLTWPKLITVDFGPSDCLGSDGRNRRGIITIHATGEWKIPGTVVTISFDNYYIDNYKVEGTEIITNDGRNASNNLVYSVDVQNAKITKPDNTFLTWASQREHEWIEGEPTILNPYDDGYMITGSYAGVSSGNENYTIDIIDPLYIHLSCQWIKSGIIDINIDNMSPIRVDYGSGSCDPNADVIYEGQTYPLVMQ